MFSFTTLIIVRKSQPLINVSTSTISGNGAFFPLSFSSFFFPNFSTRPSLLQRKLTSDLLQKWTERVLIPREVRRHWLGPGAIQSFININREPESFGNKEVAAAENAILNSLKHYLITALLTMGKTAGGFYAVARGRSVGVYQTWDDCKAQVSGFPNARYKKFPSSQEAESFIQENRDNKTESSKISSSSKPTSSSVTASGSGVKEKVISTSFTKSATAFPRMNSISSYKDYSAPAAAPIAVAGQKRSFSKTALKVTEDRVINKRAKMDTSNSGVDLGNFSVDEDGYVVVYTDGACTKNGRKAAKAGIGVWFGSEHPLNISEPVIGRQTNNTAEIQAAERAIKQAKQNGINKLKVKTDSQFTINCVTKWLYNWKRNNWRLSSGGDVKNKEDLIKLDQAMQNMEIKWSYVAGHAGIIGNEAADRLAVAGAERSVF